MGKVIGVDYYFDEPGSQNTGDVIENVKRARKSLRLGK